ncbi:MAG: OmpH family outer membrane protein [Bacteroidetes bacterium]|nr:OmpH family outer membrane protein [Bacteroidota bacterium]MDA1242268.1 OmpH family outer membrane protein [Bacteroidota bacterium]
MMISSKVFWPVVAVLVLWLGVLSAGQWGGKKSVGQRAADGGHPVVAYVHGDSLQRGLNLLKNLQANLMAQMEERDLQLQQDALPLQEEAQELIDYANSGAATEDELMIADRRVREIENTLRAMQMAAEQDLLVAEQNMQAVIAEALRRHLEAHADDEGIDLILNWGLSGEGVLYGSEPWDITDAVLERINAAHGLSPALSAGKKAVDSSALEDPSTSPGDDAR